MSTNCPSQSPNAPPMPMSATGCLHSRGECYIPSEEKLMTIATGALSSNLRASPVTIELPQWTMRVLDVEILWLSCSIADFRHRNPGSVLASAFIGGKFTFKSLSLRPQRAPQIKLQAGGLQWTVIGINDEKYLKQDLYVFVDKSFSYKIYINNAKYGTSKRLKI